VADLDRRLAQIDRAIEEAAKRGKTNTALSAMEAQRRAARASPVSETRRPALWPPSRRNAPAWAAKGRAAETEAAPVRYVAELLGTDTESERAIPVRAHGVVS